MGVGAGSGRAHMLRGQDPALRSPQRALELALAPDWEMPGPDPPPSLAVKRHPARKTQDDAAYGGQSPPCDRQGTMAKADRP